MGCLSFNGNKIITSGGGGMLLTQDAELAQRAKHLSTQAKTDAIEYLHDEVGYNYRLVNVLAAIGVAQMELLAEFVARKQAIAATYREALAGVGDIRFQAYLPEVAPNEWLFTIRTTRSRELMQHLHAAGIGSRPLWTPLHRQPMFAHSPYISTADHATALHAEGLSLPCSTHLSAKEQAYVVDAIRNFYI